MNVWRLRIQALSGMTCRLEKARCFTVMKIDEICVQRLTLFCKDVFDVFLYEMLD